MQGLRGRLVFGGWGFAVSAELVVLWYGAGTRALL